ncbi:YdeI/OmpD-associated family protein [Paradevosia shaoguanensis]|uniref:YdeI/OmpD-associated family protein n=1 Tax=Paradevosia shaoguanensis TaxID=1335043 RepID=UPI003C724781
MKFTTTLLSTGGNTAGIEITPEALAALGGGKRPAVVVTINGFTYRTSIGSMNGKSLVPVSAERRRESGTAAGDTIEVELVLDTEKREVIVPDDLKAALVGAGKIEAFGQLSYSNQNRMVLSVTDARTPETRQRRIDKVLAELAG